MLTADQKIQSITKAFKTLAQELRLSGQLKISNIAEQAAKELPDSSKLKLYEILKD